VVEFLVDQFGPESLQRILHDLAAGIEINQAIETHTAPLEDIETDFAAFARERAEKLAPGLDWENAKEAAKADEQWLSKHPTNYYALTHVAKRLLNDKKYREAQEPLKKLLQLYPADTGPDNAHRLLADAYRSLNETNSEREILSGLAAMDADDLDTFLRLMDLYSAKSDWDDVSQNAARFIAVNPLLAEPYQYLARAREALGDGQPAIAAYQTLLLLEPPDPADAHFHLARLLHQTGDPAAKRHVLQALEEAPRFREAHRLLLEISRQTQPEQP